MRNGQTVAALRGDRAGPARAVGSHHDEPGPSAGVSHSFRTRQSDDACDVIRTFGTIVQAPPGPLRFHDDDALRCVHPNPPPNCARGKVVAYSQNAQKCDVACFQVGDCHATARLAACCNGTAAAAADFAALTNAPRVAMQVKLPGRHVVRVDARIRRAAGSTTAVVGQCWNHVPFSISAESEVDGRRYAVCAGPFNHYLIIQTRLGEFAADFRVDAALEVWQRFGLVDEPLLSRIGVVEPGAAAAPAVRFFTCGDRAHPSAPLSGLAVAAAVAHRLQWRFLLDATRVRTAAGTMPLPRLKALSDGAMCVQFPDVIVDFPALPTPAERV